MAMDVMDLSPTKDEVPVVETPIPPLADALAARAACVDAEAKVKAARLEAEAAYRDAVAANNAVLAQAPFLKLLAKAKQAITKADVKAAGQAVDDADVACIAAQNLHILAMNAVLAASAIVEAAAVVHYETLTKDGRRGPDEIPCMEWRADESEGEPCCHCHEADPRNTWEGEPPHDASNYEGKAWCAIHQVAEDWPAHAIVSLAQFVARFALAQQ